MAKNLPKQVQKQSEEVQELYKDMNQEEDTTEEVTDTSDSAPEQATKPEQEEQKVSGTQDESFEQKYKTLQGMYNAEVPQLKADNQNLTNRLNQMEQLITSMDAAKSAPPAEPVKPPSLVTQADIDEYGESIDVMRKVSKEESAAAQNRIAELENKLQELQSNVLPRVEQAAQNAKSSQEQIFWSELNKSVPNWKDINNNQDFQTWLLQTDPLTGISRQSYLDDAQRQFDATRVSNFFTTWESLNGSPNAQSAKPASELDKQIAPKRGRNTGTPESSSGQTYSPADITKFFKDVQLGKYKGREKERDRIERDIFAAQKQGRIVNA